MEAAVTQLKLDNLGIEPYHRMVGILGGTFNPVHEGHIDIAEKVFLEFELSCVYFIVDGDPPHKSNLTSAKDRLEMVRLATSKHDFLIPSDIEISRPGKTYTVDTLRLLKDKFPQDEFYYIIGADTLFEIETWKDIEEVCRLTDFICIGRSGISEKDSIRKSRELSDSIGARILHSEQSGFDISSTDIRMLAEKGEDISGLVPESVRDYITKNGLYKRQK